MKCLITMPQNSRIPARYTLLEDNCLNRKKVTIDEVIPDVNILDFCLSFGWDYYSIAIGQIEEERFWFIDRNLLKGQIFADVHAVEVNEFILEVAHKYSHDAAHFIAQAVDKLSLRYFTNTGHSQSAKEDIVKNEQK